MNTFQKMCVELAYITITLAIIIFFIATVAALFDILGQLVYMMINELTLLELIGGFCFSVMIVMVFYGFDLILRAIK